MSLNTCNQARGSRMKGILDQHLISVAVMLGLGITAFGAEKDAPRIDPGQIYQRQAGWSRTMLACRERLQRLNLSDQEINGYAAQILLQVMRDFPVRADWMLQDYGLMRIAGFGHRTIATGSSA